jgi:hypothetical protein
MKLYLVNNVRARKKTTVLEVEARATNGTHYHVGEEVCKKRDGVSYHQLNFMLLNQPQCQNLGVEGIFFLLIITFYFYSCQKNTVIRALIIVLYLSKIALILFQFEFLF